MLNTKDYVSHKHKVVTHSYEESIMLNRVTLLQPVNQDRMLIV